MQLLQLHLPCNCRRVISDRSLAQSRADNAAFQFNASPEFKRFLNPSLNPPPREKYLSICEIPPILSHFCFPIVETLFCVIIPQSVYDLTPRPKKKIQTKSVASRCVIVVFFFIWQSGIRTGPRTSTRTLPEPVSKSPKAHCCHSSAHAPCNLSRPGRDTHFGITFQRSRLWKWKWK